MGKKEGSKSVTHTTTIHGAVHGPVHTGSGDIHADSIEYGMDAKEKGRKE